MQIFTKDFAKGRVEYPFNPIDLTRTTIAKESLFFKAFANAQLERNLRARSHWTLSISDAKKWVEHASLAMSTNPIAKSAV